MDYARLLNSAALGWPAMDPTVQLEQRLPLKILRIVLGARRGRVALVLNTLGTFLKLDNATPQRAHHGRQTVTKEQQDNYTDDNQLGRSKPKHRKKRIHSQLLNCEKRHKHKAGMSQMGRNRTASTRQDR